MSARVCEGRVVAVTGAGQGIGRGYALEFARHGARVVVNDIAGAGAVVDEIVAAGGEAIAHDADVATWDGAGSLVAGAVDAFGGLDVLVNNAGILRDRPLATMSGAEWDAVVAVNLTATFATCRHAVGHWRERQKAGLANDARIINTSSPSGLFGNPGQSNYGAAKAGVAAFTAIVAAEVGRYGVTANAVAPTARTRLTEPFLGAAPASGFDRLAPENIAPLVVWLGSAASAGITGRVFGVVGGTVTVLEGWVNGPAAEVDRRWTPQELGDVIPDLVGRAAPAATMSGDRPAVAAR